MAKAVVMIRRATVADASALCRIHQESVRIKARSHYSEAMIEAWIGKRQPEDYRWAIIDESIWVAMAGERLVGFASLKGNELMALYTDVQAPRGTGRTLLDAAIAEAHVNGVSELFATCSLNAVPFYAAHGFHELGPTELTRSGCAIAAICMRKRIGATDAHAGQRGSQG